MAVQFFDGPSGWAMLVGVLLAMLATVLPDKVPSEAYRRFYTSCRWSGRLCSRCRPAAWSACC